MDTKMRAFRLGFSFSAGVLIIGALFSISAPRIAHAGAPPDEIVWFDGYRQHRAYLHRGAVAQFEARHHHHKPSVQTVSRNRAKSLVARGAASSSQILAPVFTDSPSSQHQTRIPAAGVFVVLDPSFTDTQVEDWAKANELEIESKLSFKKNGILVKTDPGMDALERMAEIQKLPSVVAAWPNWVTPVRHH